MTNQVHYTSFNRNFIAKATAGTIDERELLV